MPSRKSAQSSATSSEPSYEETQAPKWQRKPLADRREKLAASLVPVGWYDAQITSVDLTVAKTGNEGWQMQLTKRDPLYAGRLLYFVSYQDHVKGRSVLTERFPGIDWDDSDDILDAFEGR